MVDNWDFENTLNDKSLVSKHTYISVFSNESNQQQVDLPEIKPQKWFQLHKKQLSYDSSFCGLQTFVSKFKARWQRVRLILKCYFILCEVRKDIQTYGTSCNFIDINQNYKKNILQLLKKQTTNQVKEIPLPFGLLHPNCKFKQLWYFVLIFLLLYTATLMPYKIGFIESDDDNWYAFNIVIDALFCIDLIVNFISSYYKDEGILERSRKKIAMKYFKSWFLFDFVACLPVQLFEEITYMASGRTGDYNNLVKLARLPRLYRLLRIVRLIKLLKFARENEVLQKITDYLQINQGLMRLTCFIIGFLIMVHLVGCIWFFQAKMLNFGPDTWVARKGFQNESNGTLYLLSIYWAFTTLMTVGYGDISAQNNIERSICIMWMICGGGFFTFTVGTLSSVLANMDTRQQNLNQKTIYINTFAKDAKISFELRERLRKALEYTSNKQCFNWNEKKNHFLNLPLHLRVEVAQAIHRGVLKNIYFFKKKQGVFIYLTAINLTPMYLKEGEIVYKENDYPYQIYFIVHGRVHYVQGSYIYKSLNHGTYFGEIEIFLQTPRANTLQVDQQSDMDLLTLEKNTLISILEMFPDVKMEMIKIAEERKVKNQLAKQELNELLDFYKHAQKQAKQFAKQNLMEKDQFIYHRNKFKSIKKYQRQPFSDLLNYEFDVDQQSQKTIENINRENILEEKESKQQDNVWFGLNDKVECQSAMQFYTPQSKNVLQKNSQKIQKLQKKNRGNTVEFDNEQQLNETFDTNEDEQDRKQTLQTDQKSDLLDLKRKKHRTNSEPDFVIKKFIQQKNSQKKKVRFDFDLIEKKTVKKPLKQEVKQEKEKEKEKKKAKVIFRVAMEQILLDKPKNSQSLNDTSNHLNTERILSKQIKRDWAKIAMMRENNKFFGKKQQENVTQSTEIQNNLSLNALQLGKYFSHQIPMKKLNEEDKNLINSQLKDLKIDNHATDTRINDQANLLKLNEFDQKLNQTIKKQSKIQIQLDVMKQQMEGLLFLLNQQKASQKGKGTFSTEANQTRNFIPQFSQQSIQVAEDISNPQEEQIEPQFITQNQKFDEKEEIECKNTKNYNLTDCITTRTNSTSQTEEHAPPISLKSKINN